MPLDLNFKVKDWICWLGIGSSICILFIVALAFRGGSPSPWEATGFVGLGLLPAFISLFTSLVKRFWLNLIIGLWYLFAGIMTSGETGFTSFFLLAALTLSSTPILNIIFSNKQIDKRNNSVSSQ